MVRIGAGPFLLAILSSASALGGGTIGAFGASRVGQQGGVVRTVPEEPRADVLKALCASQFGQGDFARVEVFRNASGAVRVLALRPDIDRFTHAPHTYYGPDGTPLVVVPERPVTPEELKSDPVLRKRDEILEGLTERGSTFCSKHR